MRAVLIGDPAVNGLAHALRVGLENNGWVVTPIPWGAWSPSWLAHVGHHWPRAAKPLTWRLRRSVALAGHADLVVVVKGAFVSPEDVEWFRDMLGAPVVCWNPDDPFDAAISNRGAGIPEAIGAYDHYVTWSETVAERLRCCNASVLVVPFGWDPSSFFPESGGTVGDRIVFVGSWTAEREEWIRGCRGFRPIVFGDRWRPIPSVEHRPAVYGSALRQVLSSAGASLNFLRPQNRTSHNMRTFEIPACGGRQVAQRSAEHTKILGPHGIELFDDLDELLAILAAAREPAGERMTPPWLERHSYAERVGQLLAAIWQ